MSTDKYLTYRGDLRALAAVEGTLAFVTAHPEGMVAALIGAGGVSVERDRKVVHAQLGHG